MKDKTEDAEVKHQAIQGWIGETNQCRKFLHRVQITRDALIQRLDRLLVQGLRQLRKSRVPYTRITLGDYHIPEVHCNFVVKPHTTIDRMEEIARQLGVLQKWEEVEK